MLEIGKTITAMSASGGQAIKIKLSASTFTKSPANNSSSGSSIGNYQLNRLSPVAGIFLVNFTSANDVGQSVALQLTFTSTTGGTFFAMIFDSQGVLHDVDFGTFSM